MRHRSAPTRQGTHRGKLVLAGLALGLVATGAPACDGGDTTGSGGSTSASGCADDPRVQAYSVGLEATSASGAIAVRFLDADPAPPAKGDNVWRIAIEDASGARVDDATLSFDATMPDHGHSSTVAPAVTFEGDGEYVLDPVNLFMPGVWEITLDVAPPGGTVESVKVGLCVEG